MKGWSTPVATVADGGSVFDPQLLRSFLSAIPPHQVEASRQDRAALASLTPAETNLLEMVGSGKSNREIAKIQRFTVGTIKNQLARRFKKIGATNRVDAARIDYRSGVVR